VDEAGAWASSRHWRWCRAIRNLALLGAIQFMRGRSDEAIDTLVQSLKLRPQDALSCIAWRCYEAQKDFGNALAAARRAC